MEETSELWYFSFGANMNGNVLAARGGIEPKQSLAGKLSGWRLAFTMKGYAGVEPAWANIEPIDSGDGPGNSEVHGVAHLLTGSDLDKLDRHEGQGYAYERQTALFAPYCQNIGGGENEEQPKGDSTDTLPLKEVQVYVAVPSMTVAADLPSERYLKIMVDGAREARLSEAYLTQLQSRESFSFAGTLMPTPSPELTTTVTPDEVRAHPFIDGEDTTATWVCMGGLVYDATGLARQRAMVRNMCRPGEEGTRFVLRLLAAGYGIPGGGQLPEPFSSGTQLAALTQQQCEYVACWAQYFEAQQLPLIGVLNLEG